MKANELRIGNKVKLDEDIIEIVTLSKKEIGHLYSKRFLYTSKLSTIKPIPLTEEWLEKAGFKTRVTINHSVQYFIGENPITHDWLFDILWLEGYSEPFYRNGFHKIKYVHELQNLYFALTGSDLVFSTEP